VKTQIMVAAGEKLPFTQRQIEIRGHAIECRVNAEDPYKFTPSPGRITMWHMPGGPGVRVDSHVYNNYFVPPNYDSMIGKIIVHGDTREQALARMRAAAPGADGGRQFHRRRHQHPLPGRVAVAAQALMALPPLPRWPACSRAGQLFVFARSR
jgi:acetyl/propionyl-CoA carboxylase alpha subunit